ncbi:hypothetical protein DFH07DRAFT_808501 [Mycena maculata]|uniref:Uncharacterized protein n=1 Tax=Mycena maculata TaxID=230809 RepID=A0AAD7JLH8_9AGAR|nr:hypothetical protein DFH07DRAFT_808501 [Mycena maculata]
MDFHLEARAAHRATAIKAEQFGSPRRKRSAALTSSLKSAEPFKLLGAFDSQTDSQEFVEEIYKAAGQSMHVKTRTATPSDLDSETHSEESTRPNSYIHEHSETNVHDELLLRAVEAEEALENVRAELKKTQRALAYTKQKCEKWRTAAIEASIAVGKVSKHLSAAQNALNVIEVLSDSD